MRPERVHFGRTRRCVLLAYVKPMHPGGQQSSTVCKAVIVSRSLAMLIYGRSGVPSKESQVAKSCTGRRDRRVGSGGSGHPTARWAAMR
jgi:hypothetical protein